jgi:hypothetical protein
MSEPLKENEALESEIIAVVIEMFDKMRRLESRLPRAVFEKHLRPHLRLAFLRARQSEAERCESYRIIGSPRIIELKVAANQIGVEIAQLEGEKKKRP